MSRSKWKGPQIDTQNLKALTESKNYKNTIVSRNTIILPTFINQIFEVYNGKKFIEVVVVEGMIGHKFGEFSSTRKRFSFKKTAKKK